MKQFTTLSAVLGVILFIFSCTKGPGEGGSSSIKGKLIVHTYCCAWDIPIDTFPAQAEDIYIVYGEDEFYGDNVETHYDGTFKFNFLRKGDYTIYAYSKDSSDTPSPTGDVAVIKKVTISEKNEEVDMGDLIILDD